jgi:hypothetical protein
MKMTHLAEQATLGALLLQPNAVREVATWLRVGDFAHPWHQTVYRVIADRHAAGAAIDPKLVGADLMQRLGPARADLPRVVGLLQAAPDRPQPTTYAAMVLESSLRREVAGQGVFLRAAALSAALTGGRRPVTAVTALVDATLDAAAGRWAAATGQDIAAPPGRGAVPVPLRAALRNLHDGLGADRFLAAHPPLDPAAVRDHEAQLIACLVAHPQHIPATARWLKPEAITNRPWRPVYTALVELCDRGRPVDVVTVAWEIQRTSYRCGRGPELRELRTTVDHTAAVDPGHLAQVVAGDHLRQVADHAADGLQASAANPGVDVRDLLGTGHLFTAALRDAAIPLPDGAEEAFRRLAVVRDPRPAGHDLDGPVAG